MRFLILLLLLSGCGEGTNVALSQIQTNDQNQTQNEPPLNCTIICNVNANQQVVDSSLNCEGGASSVIAVASISECEVLNEVESEEEEVLEDSF